MVEFMDENNFYQRNEIDLNDLEKFANDENWLEDGFYHRESNDYVDVELKFEDFLKNCLNAHHIETYLKRISTLASPK